jgi:hypothetical protein
MVGHPEEAAEVSGYDTLRDDFFRSSTAMNDGAAE